MSEFVRVKLVAYEAGNSSTVASGGPGMEYVTVKVLEAFETGAVQHFLVLHITDKLSVSHHVQDDVCKCAQSLHIIRVLRCHSMNDQLSTDQSCLPNCSMHPAFGGVSQQRMIDITSKLSFVVVSEHIHTAWCNG